MSIHRLPGRRRRGRLLVAPLVAAALAACATAPPETASAPAAETAAAEPAGHGARIFTSHTGEIVMGAQRYMGEEDYAGALAELDRAMASGPNAYETGVILYMRGAVKYQLDDVDGALADWKRARAEGDLLPTERLTLSYNIAQLHLTRGEHAAAVEALEAWLASGGTPTSDVHLNMVAAYAEIDDFGNALRHALQALSLANPPQRRHYDTLVYLYTELGMTGEREALIDRALDALPELTRADFER